MIAERVAGVKRFSKRGSAITRVDALRINLKPALFRKLDKELCILDNIYVFNAPEKFESDPLISQGNQYKNPKMIKMLIEAAMDAFFAFM